MDEQLCSQLRKAERRSRRKPSSSNIPSSGYKSASEIKPRHHRRK